MLASEDKQFQEDLPKLKNFPKFTSEEIGRAVKAGVTVPWERATSDLNNLARVHNARVKRLKRDEM